MAQLVRNLPAMWETWVRSLGWKDPLEKRKATHSSTLAWRIPRTESMGSKELDMTEQLSLSLNPFCVFQKAQYFLHLSVKKECNLKNQLMANKFP